MEGFNKNVFDPKIATGLDFNAFPNKKRWKPDMDLFPNGLSNVPTYTPIYGVPLELGYMEHSLALNFNNRIRSGGGGLKDNEYFGVNYRCWAYEILQLNGLERCYYPLLAGNDNEAQRIINASYNLISSSFPLNATSISSSMISKNGYRGNGTSSYWDTGFIPSANISLNNHNVSFFCRSGNAGKTTDMGAVSASSAALQIYLDYSFSSFTRATGADNYNDTTGRIIINNANISAIGWNSNSRLASNNGFISKNGIVLNRFNSGGSLPSRSIWLGACNHIDSNFIQHSNREYSAFSIGTGFSERQEQIRSVIEYNVQSFWERL